MSSRALQVRGEGDHPKVGVSYSGAPELGGQAQGAAAHLGTSLALLFLRDPLQAPGGFCSVVLESQGPQAKFHLGLKPSHGQVVSVALCRCGFLAWGAGSKLCWPTLGQLLGRGPGLLLLSARPQASSGIPTQDLATTWGIAACVWAWPGARA